jgi:putative membrane protein
VSDSSNKKSARRAPRTFDLSPPAAAAATAAEAATTATASKNASSKSKAKPAKRKPKSFDDRVDLREIPDEAAQRVGPDPSSREDLAAELTPPPPPALKASKGQFGWGRLFWIALVGLVTLSIGLWVDELITALFARNDWLGWLATGIVGLLALASFALTLREFWGLSRMARIDRLRSQAADASQNDDAAAARKVADQLLDLYGNRPDTARGRSLVQEDRDQIIDGRDRISLLERDLMHPLDQQAKSLVMASAKRVSVVTAVSPRALIDVGYVLYENTKLIRQIAELYGGRPGTLGFWRLARNVVGHLAVTGTIAVGEGLIQQLVGQGVAAKLSSRLGEGVINGMLTARIGIAAVDLCRPLPFTDQTRLSVSDFMGELINLSGKGSSSNAA